MYLSEAFWRFRRARSAFRPGRVPPLDHAADLPQPYELLARAPRAFDFQYGALSGQAKLTLSSGLAVRTEPRATRFIGKTNVESQQNLCPDDCLSFTGDPEPNERLLAADGGFFILNALIDITLPQYIERVQLAADINDLIVGMIKAPVFAFFIGIIGCMHGLRVTGSAESIGRETTTSVVKGIFLVLVLDAFFSILFQKVGL